MAKYTQRYRFYLPENRDDSLVHEFGMQENFVKLEELITGGTGGDGADYDIWDENFPNDNETKKVITNFYGNKWDNHVDEEGNPHETLVDDLSLDTGDADVSASLIRNINEGNHSLVISSSFIEQGGTGSTATYKELTVDDPNEKSKTTLRGEVIIDSNPFNSNDSTNVFTCNNAATFGSTAFFTNNVGISTGRDIYKGTNTEDNRYLTRADIVNLIDSEVRALLSGGTITQINTTNSGKIFTNNIESLGGQLDVTTGVLEVSGGIEALGPSQISNTLRVTGATTLGTVSTGNVSVSGQVVSTGDMIAFN